MSRVRRALRWYARQPAQRQAALNAIPIAVVTYLTALLGAAVAESLKVKGLAQFGLVSLAIIGLVVLAVVTLQWLTAIGQELNAETDRQHDALGSAYELADAWMLAELKTLAAVRSGSTNPVVLAPADPMTAFDKLVDAAYSALTLHYGQARQTDERIDFEVTFMTISYADGGITIPAWANRDGRKPKSMQARPGNIQLYDNTVTAEVYRADSTHMRIVEDTEDPQSSYAELYSGQKQRIKSSVVCPILSSENELLGTLVLHCDRKRFFLERDRKFWTDFCEVFTKRIAFEKQLLDRAAIPTGAEQLGPDAWVTKPF